MSIGRPREGRDFVIYARVSSAVKNKVRIESEQKGVSESVWIQKLLEDYFGMLPREEDTMAKTKKKATKKKVSKKC